MKFTNVCHELRITGFASTFAEHGDEIEGVLAKEPITNSTINFHDCLDYMLTDMRCLEKCPVYNTDGGMILPNPICVSDHSPLIAVFALSD